MAEENPIISKWRSLPPADNASELIGKGNEGFVFKETFVGEAGETSMVEKQTESESVAKHAVEVYRNFKSYNLPVVKFLKMGITGSNETEGGKFYSLYMEDLTEGGKYQISKKDEDFGNWINLSKDKDKLRQQILQALAVIHNNGYFNFHPPQGLGFVLRRPKAAGKASQVDFKIIDYTNFRREDDEFPKENNSTYKYKGTLTAADSVKVDLWTILMTKFSQAGLVGDQLKDLKQYYEKQVANNILTYKVEDDEEVG